MRKFVFAVVMVLVSRRWIAHIAGIKKPPVGGL